MIESNVDLSGTRICLSFFISGIIRNGCKIQEIPESKWETWHLSLCVISICGRRADFPLEIRLL
jgi:hypothetical protein